MLIDHDTLVADLTAVGIAQTSTGEKITAGQARRLACQAGLRAAVLGTNSEVLDLGRESRLFNPAQRIAMEIRDKTCTEAACTMPAAYCEAHHPQPWSQAARPTSTTASSCAPSTTTAPTTPAGSPTTTPTDPRPSPDANSVV